MACSCSAALILLPTANWRFRAQATKLLAASLDADPPPSRAKSHRDLSKQMGVWSEGNQAMRHIRSVFFLYACIAFAFAVDAGLWTIDLGDEG